MVFEQLGKEGVLAAGSRDAPEAIDVAATAWRFLA
jgi:hypothetical protein